MTELTARIPTTTETRDEIRALRRGSERYEDVLQRLIRVYEENTDEDQH